jgi:flagellar biosynthetic protein FliS
MTNPTAPLAYRRASLQHASVVGLVIALHDTLIGNLQRAAVAIDEGKIQTRCDELSHGFKVLTQLDAMLDMKNGGETAIKIRTFYNHLRRQMLNAQFKLDSGILYSQVKAVLDVRAAWQQVDETSSANAPAALATPAAFAGNDYAADAAETRTSFSCSG